MKQIASALLKAQKSFAPALKTETNPFFKNKYANLSACIESVIDSLHENGISLIQKTHTHSEGMPLGSALDGILIETLLIHESGETISGGILYVPASKKDPQAYGSALTYARRYSLMATCGIAPEDDDGNAASDFIKKNDELKKNNTKQKSTDKGESMFSVEEVKTKIKNAKDMKSLTEAADLIRSLNSDDKELSELRSTYREKVNKLKLAA